MIKYLTSEGALSTERNAGTDKAVVFEFDLSELMETVYETCQNMVKTAYDQNGNTLIDEYSMSSDTPTTAMKNNLLRTSCSKIMRDIHWLVSDDIMTDPTGGYNVKYGDDEKMARIPIDNIDTYQASVLGVMELAIHDMIVYGVLEAWFGEVAGEQLRVMSGSRYNNAEAQMLSVIGPAYRKYRFNKIKNYV